MRMNEVSVKCLSLGQWISEGLCVSAGLRTDPRVASHMAGRHCSVLSP